MATHYSAIVEDLNEMFKRDYIEFVRDRKRWKSDFDMAISSAQNNFNQIEALYDKTTEQNEKNMRALKLLMDAQMIQ